MIEAGIFLSVKLDTNTENRRGKKTFKWNAGQSFQQPSVMRETQEGLVGWGTPSPHLVAIINQY